MKIHQQILLAALVVLSLGCRSTRPDGKMAYPSMGTIERLDPRFDRLVPAEAVLEKLADGFSWAEGPVWVAEGEFLLFSDIPKNTVFRWKEGEGISEFLKPSGYTGSTPRGGEPGSNGLTLNREGQLVLCEHGDRRVALLSKMEKDGPQATIVDRYEEKRLNSPNDLVFKSNGDLYFTDPPYGLEKLNEDPKKELPWNGVYRLSRDGRLTLLTREMTFPNGIAFSPDEKTLYVANSDPKKAVWMAFEVREDGTLGQGRVLVDATPWMKTRIGIPDGLKVDSAGNLFATGPGGINVIAPDGTLLGRIDTGVPTANCAFGEDGSVLYVTADKSLCRIRLSTKGLGF